MDFHLYVPFTNMNLQIMTGITLFPPSLARTPREVPIPIPVKGKTQINLENSYSYSIASELELDDRNKKSSQQSVSTARDGNQGKILHNENQHR